MQRGQEEDKGVDGEAGAALDRSSPSVLTESNSHSVNARARSRAHAGTNPDANDEKASSDEEGDMEDDDKVQSEFPSAKFLTSTMPVFTSKVTQTSDAVTDAIRVANKAIMRRKQTQEHMRGGGRSVCRRRIQLVNEHLSTKILVGLVIFLNALHVGLDTDNLAYHEQVSSKIELFFTCFFIVEIGLRLYVERVSFFSTRWNLFDFVLVALACADSLLLQLFSTDEDVGAFSAIRIIRLARLARVVRLFKAFKELWLFVAGILSAIRTLGFASPIVFVLIYMCGTATTRIFGQTYGTTDEDMQEYFGTVGRSMFTLFQCMTGEGWPDIARATMAHAPWSAIFFVCFMCITSFALTSVLVGVIVENAFSTALITTSDLEKRAQAERVKICENIIHIFREADKDGDRELSSDEFKVALKEHGPVKKWLLAVGVDTREAERLFDILDYNGSGHLDLKEFGEGLLKARGAACAQDVLSLHCDFWRAEARIARRIQEVQAEIMDLHCELREQVGEIISLIANR